MPPPPTHLPSPPGTDPPGLTPLAVELVIDSSGAAPEVRTDYAFHGCSPSKADVPIMRQVQFQAEAENAGEVPNAGAMEQILTEVINLGAVQDELRADVKSLATSVGGVHDLLSDTIEDLHSDLDSLNELLNFRTPKLVTNGCGSYTLENFASDDRLNKGKAKVNGILKRISSYSSAGATSSTVVTFMDPHRQSDVITKDPLGSRSDVSPSTRLLGEESIGLHSKSAAGSSRLSNLEQDVWPLNLAPQDALKKPFCGLSNLATILSSDTLKLLQDNNLSYRPTWMAGSKSGGTWLVEEVSLGQRLKNSWSRMILDPSQQFRMVLDITSLLVLCHDLSMIPMVVAWDIELVGVLAVGAWATLIFWTADIVFSFLTGYYHEGELIMDPAKIARKYLRTWFWIDSFVVCFDWASTILSLIGRHGGNYSESLNMIKVAKMGRLLRLFSLLRLLRGNKLFDRLMEHSLSDYLHIGIQVIKIFFAILAIAHWMSCAWYAVGRLGSVSPAWIDNSVVMEDSDNRSTYREMTIAYQYFSSFHWSVSQMASGAMDIAPQNSIERAFNIVCLLFGLLFGSSLVSLLSAFIIQLQDLRSEETKVLAQLRKFLRQNTFDRGTVIQVQKQVKERIGRQKRLHDKEVKGLEMISNSLRSQLKIESFAPLVNRHPLFRLWGEVESTAVEYLCCHAITYRFLEIGDDFLGVGDPGTHMYLHISGQLNYHDHGRPDTHMRGGTPSKIGTAFVEEGSWLCEAALWSIWTHVGSFVAVTACHLMCLHVATFWEAVSKFPNIGLITKEYGRLFHQRLISSCPPTAEYPNDIYVPFTDYEEITNAMEDDLRRIIGQVSLQKLHHNMGKRAHLTIYRKEMQKLNTEVTSGKCTLIVNQYGLVQRVVAVVAVNVTRADGTVLVQIGSINDDGSCSPNCNLPGTKMERDETPTRAVLRLMYTEILPYMGATELLWTECSQLVKESEHYGVLTKYLRTVFHARLDSWFEAYKIPKIYAADVISSSKSTEPGRHSAAMIFGHTSTRMNSEQPAPWKYFQEHRLHSRGVYIVTSTKMKTQAFAWLTEEEFKYLKSIEGKSDLEYWTKMMFVEPSLIPPPCHTFQL